jgi:hypothetical protein
MSLNPAACFWKMNNAALLLQRHHVMNGLAFGELAL